MRMRVYIDKDGEIFSCAPIDRPDTGSPIAGELKMSLTDPSHIENEDVEGMFLDEQHQYVTDIAKYDIDVPDDIAMESKDLEKSLKEIKEIIKRQNSKT